MHPTPQPALEFLTVEQVAAALQTTPRSIFRWVSEGRLPPPRKFGKLARFDKAVIDQILSVGGIAAKNPAQAAINQIVGNQPAEVQCPHCGSTLAVGRGGVELVHAPKSPRKSAQRNSTPPRKKK